MITREITLQQAKAYGRDLDRHGNPVGHETKKASKKDRTPTETPCLGGCGELVARTFKAGHDMRTFRVAREHLTSQEVRGRLEDGLPEPQPPGHRP